MDKYWRNASGYYDPTVAKVIELESQARHKEIHEAIKICKRILRNNNLELVGRMVIKDIKSGKVYK